MAKRKKPLHTTFTTRDGVLRCTQDGCQVHADGNRCLTPDAPGVCPCPTCSHWGGEAPVLATVTCPAHPYLVLGLAGDEIARCPACEAEDDEIALESFEGPAS